MNDGPSYHRRLCMWTCEGCENARNEWDAARCEICRRPAPRFEFAVRLREAAADRRHWLCIVRMYAPPERRAVCTPAAGGEPLCLAISGEEAMTREAVEAALREELAVPAASAASPSHGRGRRSPPPGPGIAKHRTHLKPGATLTPALREVAPHRKGSLFTSVTEDASLRLQGQTEQYDYSAMMERQRATMRKRTEDMKQEEADERALQHELSQHTTQDHSVAALSSATKAHVAGMVQRKPCGLCEREYLVPNLVGLTYWRSIAELRKKWGAPLPEGDKRITKPDNMYSEVRLCVFCTQFFDANFSEHFDFAMCAEGGNSDLLRHRHRNFAIQARQLPPKSVSDTLSQIQINMLREKKREKSDASSVRLNRSQLLAAMTKSAPSLLGGASAGGDTYGGCSHMGCLCKQFTNVQDSKRCIKCGHSTQWHVVLDQMEVNKRYMRRRAAAKAQRKLQRERAPPKLPPVPSRRRQQQLQEEAEAEAAQAQQAKPKRRRRRRRRPRQVEYESSGPPLPYAPEELQQHLMDSTQLILSPLGPAPTQLSPLGSPDPDSAEEDAMVSPIRKGGRRRRRKTRRQAH